MMIALISACGPSPTLLNTETAYHPTEVAYSNPDETLPYPAPPIPLLASTPAPAQTNDLPKTYQDNEAGFEINYPTKWSVIDVSTEIKQASRGIRSLFSYDNQKQVEVRAIHPEAPKST